MVKTNEKQRVQRVRVHSIQLLFGVFIQHVDILLSYTAPVCLTVTTPSSTALLPAVQGRAGHSAADAPPV